LQDHMKMVQHVLAQCDNRDGGADDHMPHRARAMGLWHHSRSGWYRNPDARLVPSSFATLPHISTAHPRAMTALARSDLRAFVSRRCSLSGSH
jgi:hypothetical protein